MNLNQLYYLQAIAQARGLTRAADALYVTQSNLSHSMAALEEELGIPLLYKNGRDTLLTPYGQEFLAYAERAIQEIEEGKRVAQSRCSPTRGQVRLGFISAVSATLIPWCVSHFYQNPTTRVLLLPLTRNPPGASPPISPTTPWTSASAPGSTTAHLSSAPWCPRSWWPWSPPDIPWPSRSR